MFEVTYHYREFKDGDYSEETKTKKQRIGSPFEDVPLSTLAAKILSQLARRSILVVDVEIYEFARKQITYKESIDGILIKNKKFKFDGGLSMSMEDVNEPTTQHNSGVNGLAANGSVMTRVPQPKPDQILRHEVFDPEPFLLQEVKKRNLSFTVGKRYPIYSESSAGRELVYITLDDEGNRRSLNSRHFIPIPVPLINQTEDDLVVSKTNVSQKGLMWDGVVNSDVPVLRR